MKSLVAVVVLLCAVVAINGQSAPVKTHPPLAAGAKLPPQEEVDAVLRRVYGYDPAIQWKIFVIRKSTVPGMTEVLLKVKEDFQHLFITADGHYAINGDMMPFGRDL